MRELSAIFVSTFVSEDLTAVAAGVLVEQGRVHPVLAIAACAAGIYVGDLGLWLAGRLLGSRWSARYGTRAAWSWTQRGAPLAILASRLVPGTRLPLYLAAGAGGATFATFALWSFIAVAIWTPALVLVTAGFGAAVAGPLSAFVRAGWAPGIAAATCVLAFRYVVLALARMRSSRG